MNSIQILAFLAPLTVVIYWAIGVLTSARNKQWNGVVVPAIAVLGGWLMIVLYQHASVDLGGGSRAFVDRMNGFDPVFCAILLAAGAGTGADILRTFNRSDGSVRSRLVHSVGSPPRN